MVLSSQEYVGQALKTLANGLEPYIAEVLSRVAPGVAWTTSFSKKMRTPAERHRATQQQT